MVIAAAAVERRQRGSASGPVISPVIRTRSLRSRRTMKTMTCKQLGGPCDLAHRGETADDVIKSQDAHLRAAVAQADTTHEPALNDMKGRWKHPIAGMG